VVSAFGISGVIGHTVMKRTTEIAVRRALGANSAQVARLVVTDSMVAAACGVGSGVLLAAWLSQALEGLLYNVRASDPLMMAASSAALLLAAIGAALVPAPRATRVAAAVALRTD
jgi:ABC-type antimicrobial peptide transport system permease subunit